MLRIFILSEHHLAVNTTNKIPSSGSPRDHLFPKFHQGYQENHPDAEVAEVLSCSGFLLAHAFNTWKISSNSWPQCRALWSLCWSTGQEQHSQWAICFPLFLFPDWISSGKEKYRHWEQWRSAQGWALGCSTLQQVLKVQLIPAGQGARNPPKSWC